ncbi:SCO6880 family protein [Natronoglycomyces albus]|uniref:PrgI family protein n=1 Tax=Natronoglycomyces albus TaxID=2811108 RepID=A0A895XPA2_9ACTN|nr:SCO6880 family protein [Natronoglycomyces albus]QSB07184.1 hypothetical protein JQS30_16910 [Natronoglycomyces albus]
MASKQQGLATVDQRTYGQWRAGKKAGLFGLGPVTSGIGFAVVAAALLAMMFSRLAALILLLLGVAVLAPLAIRIRGRTGAHAVAARLAWWRQKRRRRHIYIAGIASRVVGTYRLPGTLATSHIITAEDGRGSDVGIVAIPSTRDYSITFAAHSEGTDLVDTDVIDSRVSRMAAWLSSLTRQFWLVQAQVTIETAPDPGTKLRSEIFSTLKPEAPSLAQEVMEQIADTYSAGAAQVKFFVTLTFRPPLGRRWNDDAVATELMARLPHMQAALVGTGAVGIQPMSAAEIMYQLRSSLDPVSEVQPPQKGWAWDDIGPVSAIEHWDSYQHDRAWSRSWGMVEAPRGNVFATTFARLADPDPDLLRKRVSLVYHPYSPGQAARLVEADKRDAQFNINKKARPSSRDLRDLAAAEQSAAEEAAGAGITSFSILATATTATQAELEDATTTMAARSGEARVDLRVMTGSQATSFYATLPVGIVLPDHATVPSL